MSARSGSWAQARSLRAVRSRRQVQRAGVPRGCEQRTPTAANPVWTQKYKDSLPDTAFLIVDKACATSKRGGRSHPLSCRHLPYKDKAGRVNKGHLKAAIGRAPQTTSVPAAMRKAAQDKARKLYAKLYG